jgi:3',5'-cyclic AMP phosphodiesterase CpdA
MFNERAGDSANLMLIANFTKITGMSTRREMIATGLAGIAGLILLPDLNVFANGPVVSEPGRGNNLLLRFAIASDIHYGQEGTGYESNSSNMIKWLNAENTKNKLDLVIINGDLVHNRPDLLPVFKTNYLDKLQAPYHTIPGNHDFADAAVWKNVFGYEDRYTLEYGDTAFLLVNTADTKGEYVCPDHAFIRETLKKFSAKKTVFVIMHIPPVKWLKEEGFLDCPETLQLLQSCSNVKALFHGHDHLLDGVRYTGKLPHFFDSHIGGDWGTDYRGYRVVEVAADHTIYTYQVNASQNPVLNANRLT